MQCPRCNSDRIQRGFKDRSLLLRFSGAQELLCNNCGLEFKGFKWAAAVKRVPAARNGSELNRRRAPRYGAHLPATIRLVDPVADDTPSLSTAVRGHCQTISSLGMGLSFAGSRIDPARLGEPGRHLLVVINLPSGAVEALVKTVTHERNETPSGSANWFVGGSIVQISEPDRARLSSYLNKRGVEDPLTT